jgi:TolB protein
MAQRYVGSLDEAGAIKVAHEFANDIILKFGGGGSLLGSRVYYVSSSGAAAGNTEVWSMNWDGTDQKPVTRLRALTIQPAVSPDGERLAFTTYAGGRPRIQMVSTETGRAMPFINQDASMNANPAWTPDSARIFYSSSASGTSQIYTAGPDGRGFTRVSHREAIEVEPKVNPKNPDVLLFVAGPGAQQIYQMTAQGTQVQRVTNGTGEASNPAWNPDGQHFAFSWTRGYATGDFNIFVADISNPSEFVQLTHSEGRNENPSWGPDGRHIVFASDRTGRGRSQIYTMLADGSQVKQLTTQGVNRSPFWGAK